MIDDILAENNARRALFRAIGNRAKDENIIELAFAYMEAYIHANEQSEREHAQHYWDDIIQGQQVFLAG